MALRVLLADESTTIKKVMQLALQDFAVEVKSVQSGVDVVEVARAFEPDVIFADVLLQKKNGYEVCAELKSHPALKTIPIVIMWSSFMELDERQAAASGADRRLEKPFDVENLRQLILELVPKTRSQRLAHFLKFPDNLVQPMHAEIEKQHVPPQAVQPPQPMPQPQASQPPQAPPWLIPPTPQFVPPPSSQPQPQPPAQAPHVSTLPPWAQPPPEPDSIKPPPTDRERELEMAPARPQSESPQSWSIESFEDISDFAERSEPDDLNDDQNEEKFQEFRIAKPPALSRVPSTDDDFVSMPTATRTPSSAEESDPWSHQDLSRFKLDLEDDPGIPMAVDTAVFQVETQVNRQNPMELEAVDEHDLAAPKLETEEVDEFFVDTTLEVEEASEPIIPQLNTPEDPTFGPEGPIPKLSPERLEEIIRAQSREVIEAIVRKVVPSLATDIIREELHRLLDEDRTGDKTRDRLGDKR